MCNFFSFISDGHGNFNYFTAADREFFRIDNPEEYEMDSHTSISAFHGVNEDACNKYEYSRDGFMIDQINTHDDSTMAEKWITEFAKGSKFRDICMELVRLDGSALYYVPMALRDKKMCLEAVMLNGWAFQFVPMDLRDKEMCLEAVYQDGRVLKYVPIDIRKEIGY